MICMDILVNGSRAIKPIMSFICFAFASVGFVCRYSYMPSFLYRAHSSDSFL